MAQAFYTAFVTEPKRRSEQWLHESLWESIQVIFWGFFLSSLFGVPLGILAGTYDLMSRLSEPFIEFFRYLPAPAFGALAVAILGIHHAPKIAIIFIGTFFQQVLVVSNTTRKLDPALLEAAQTIRVPTGEIAFRKGWLADALADGGITASKKIGKNSFDYLIQVKGMSNLHSDERATPALALNIATAARGSDHLRSRPAIDLYHLPEEVLRKIYGNPVPYDGPLSSEHTEYIGKPWQVFWQPYCWRSLPCMSGMLRKCACTPWGRPSACWYLAWCCRYWRRPLRCYPPGPGWGCMRSAGRWACGCSTISLFSWLL